MPVNQRPISFRASFDQVADDYNAVRPNYPHSLVEDLLLLAAIPPDGLILEIGCGTRASNPSLRPAWLSDDLLRYRAGTGQFGRAKLPTIAERTDPHHCF